MTFRLVSPVLTRLQTARGTLQLATALTSVAALAVSCGGVDDGEGGAISSFSGPDPSVQFGNPGAAQSQAPGQQSAPGGNPQQLGGAVAPSGNGQVAGGDNSESANVSAPIVNNQGVQQNNGNQQNGGAGGAPVGESPAMGMGGGAMVGAAGAALEGAGGVSLEPEVPVAAPEEPAPGGEPPLPGDSVNPGEVEAFLSSLPCGAKYTAMGDGSYAACVRLSDGGAACGKGAQFERVTFAGGAAVDSVAQVTSMGENQIGVVTTGGALHVGPSPTTISETPLIATGVVNASGGRQARVALVREGGGFGIRSWSEGGSPAPLALPGDEPVQVSANYGMACALGVSGTGYCWAAGGNVSAQEFNTPQPTAISSDEPFRMVSAGQDTVCGVTFGNELRCVGNLYASPYLPTEIVNGQLIFRTTTFPAVREVHAAFNQGVVIDSTGTAFYLPGGAAQGSDSPGVAFDGVTNAVASGGDRGIACVATEPGEVFCITGGGATQRATLGGAPLTAQAAACPF